MEDCIIVGAGPAGLTAAIYLARFHLSIRLFDCGTSRAALIPCTRNHAGFPEGISGIELLRRMAEQAERYGAERELARVTKIVPEDGGFTVFAEERKHRARAVLLATGVINNRPSGMDDALHAEALAKGLLRYCPICDAFEAKDRRIGALGRADTTCKKAIFLRTYSRNVILLPIDDPNSMAEENRDAMTKAGIAVPDQPAVDVERIGDKIAVALADGRRIDLDVLYPVLGCDVRSELATALGARSNDVGCVHVDDRQRTSVDGLYAAGDVVTDLHQISVATGHAAIAATEIHNSLPHNFR